MTPLQRAWKAMDDADYDVANALDALCGDSTKLLNADEHLSLDRRGWNDLTQQVARLARLRRDDHSAKVPRQMEMRLFVAVTRKGRRVQAKYPTLTRQEHERWLRDRMKAYDEDGIAVAIGSADAELLERLPKARTVLDAWKLAGVEYTVVEPTGTDG